GVIGRSTWIDAAVMGGGGTTARSAQDTVEAASNVTKRKRIRSCLYDDARRTSIQARTSTARLSRRAWGRGSLPEESLPRLGQRAAQHLLRACLIEKDEAHHA